MPNAYGPNCGSWASSRRRETLVEHLIGKRRTTTRFLSAAITALALSATVLAGNRPNRRNPGNRGHFTEANLPLT